MRWPVVLVATVGAMLVTARAEAYRPFDGTDADVAELGNFELELGPSHYYRQGDSNYLIAPDTVLNFGILPGTELVIDFQDFVALGSLAPGEPRAALLDTDVFIKHVLREGILQGKTGLSIAAELGPLTPEINGQEDFGASLDVITSYRWDFGTIHWNEWGELTRDQHWDLYTGVILEGPHDWTVRPVSELYFDREFGVQNTWSALFGAIWAVQDGFDLDVGLRGARIGDESAEEIRLGLTWAVRMWEPAASSASLSRRRAM